MLTTPIVARFHNSAASSSATAMLKLARSLSLRLRTTCRRSFNDCAASMWISSVRNAITSEAGVSLRQRFRGDLLRYKCFNHIAGFDVAVIRDRDAALHAIAHLAGVVFKAPQRADFASENYRVVTEKPDLGITLDQAIRYRASSNGANFWNTERFLDQRASLVNFLECRFQKAGHGPFDLILQLVNDRVQPDVHFFLLGQFLRFAFWTDVESDDDRIRSRSQQDVALCDRAYARTQKL